MKNPFRAIDIDDIEEWLAVWDALSRFVDSSDHIEDPRAERALSAARRVAERMDQVFIENMNPEVFHAETKNVSQ